MEYDRNQVKESAVAFSGLKPTFPKRIINAPSLRPIPERETGTVVTVTTMGSRRKISKRDTSRFIPTDMEKTDNTIKICTRREYAME